MKKHFLLDKFQIRENFNPKPKSIMLGNQKALCWVKDQSLGKVEDDVLKLFWVE